jgi:hypothetical protein
MSEPVQERKGKEPYEKPRLGVVDLKSEEVLAGGCKLGGQSGPGNTNCLNITGLPCITFGS